MRNSRNALWLAVGRAAGGLRQQARHTRQRADAQDPGRPRSDGRARPRRQGQRRAGHRRLSQVPAAWHRTHRSAPKPCAAWATWKWPAPTRAAPTATSPRAARRTTAPRSPATTTILKAYPKDPDNDRVLYQLARAQRAGRPARSRAGHARPAAGAVPEDTLPRRSAVPPWRDALQPARLPQGRSRPTPPCCAARRTTRTRAARCTCRAGRCSSRAGSRTALRSFFGVLDLKLAGDESDG